MSPHSGNTTDVCKEFVKECRRQGLVPAFYYCLWGGKDWNPNPNARAIILAQLYELATQYGEIPYFWIDMKCWGPADLSTQEIYDCLKSLQPNCVVEFNQHIQDGTQIAYFPTDVVDGELTLPPATGHNPLRTVGGKTYYLPFDYNLVSQSRVGGYDYDPLGPSCWFTYGEGRSFAPSHPFPAEAVAKQVRLGWKRGAANVLLATAPDHTGRMRPEDVEQLRRLGRILRERRADLAEADFARMSGHGVERLGEQARMGGGKGGRWRFRNSLGRRCRDETGLAGTRPGQCQAVRFGLDRGGMGADSAV